MKTIPVTIPDEVASDIERLAAIRGISAEEYLREGLDEKLVRDASFEDAARYVLEKNAELYRRLA